MNTFRVQGIPTEQNAQTTPELLNRLFELDHQESDIDVYSLAPDAGRQGEKVATIVSPRVQAAVGSGVRWRKPLLDVPSEMALTRRREVSLDVEFHGLTPLTAPDKEDYLFE